MCNYTRYFVSKIGYIKFNILSDLDPKVKVKGIKPGICDGLPSTAAPVEN